MIECVFVDAGVSAIDVERMKNREEMKNRAATQGASLGDHNELALLTVDTPKSSAHDRVALRPPILQVVRLASFHTTPSIAPFTFSKHTKGDVEASAGQKDLEEKKVADVAIGGGGVVVSVSRLPAEQKRLWDLWLSSESEMAFSGSPTGSWLLTRYGLAIPAFVAGVLLLTVTQLAL